MSKPDLAEQLEYPARKASLLAFAVTGIMELERNQGFWPLRDAADEISNELAAFAQGLTDDVRPRVAR